MLLTTKRLTLRPLLESDWALWQALHQHPDVMRYIGDIANEDTVREKFNSRLGSGLGQWRKEDNSWLTLVIEEKATGIAVGFTLFKYVDAFSTSRAGLYDSPRVSRKRLRL